MDTKTKIEFIETLSAIVTHSIIRDIRAGKIPDNWDGFELRQLLADRFQREPVQMSRQRKAEYNNTCIVNNL